MWSAVKSNLYFYLVVTVSPLCCLHLQNGQVVACVGFASSLDDVPQQADVLVGGVWSSSVCSSCPTLTKDHNQAGSSDAMSRFMASHVDDPAGGSCR